MTAVTVIIADRDSSAIFSQTVPVVNEKQFDNEVTALMCSLPFHRVNIEWEEIEPLTPSETYIVESVIN